MKKDKKPNLTQWKKKYLTDHVFRAQVGLYAYDTDSAPSFKEKRKMDNNFEYSYSAESHREIEEIRRKYVTDENDSYENKLRQLKDLDHSATRKGMIFSITIGAISTMLLGLGLTCVMVWSDPLFILGVVLGVLGLIGVCAAYPLYQHITKKERQRIAPMILKLSDELESMSS